MEQISWKLVHKVFLVPTIKKIKGKKDERIQTNKLNLAVPRMCKRKDTLTSHELRRLHGESAFL